MGNIPFKMISRMAKHAGIVASGTLLCQVFILASTPYLTRIYSPSEFGQLALMFTVSGFVISAGCLRFDLAMPGAEEKDVIPLFVLCLLLVGLLAIGVCLACILPWHRWFAHPIFKLGRSWPLLGSLVLGVGVFQAMGTYLISRGQFKRLAVQRASQGLVFASLALLTWIGLLWAHVISFFLVSVCLCGLVLWQHRSDLVRADGLGLLAVMKQYRSIPTYLLPGALLDNLGSSASIWILSSTYGLAATGQYSQIQRLVGAPMILVSMSLSQVLLKHTADQQRERKPLWPVVKSLALILLAGSLALFLVFLLAGSWGMRQFLGSKWRTDTFFVCIVTTVVLARTVVSPLSTVLLAIRRLRTALMWQACYCMSSVGVLWFLARHLTFDGFLVGLAAHEVLQYLAYFLVIRGATLAAHRELQGT